MGHEKCAISGVPPVDADGNIVAATVQCTRSVLCSMMNSGAELIAAVGKLQFKAGSPVALVVISPPVGSGGVEMVTAISSE
jgi:hypothetical protein